MKPFLLAFFIHDLRSGGAEKNIVRLVNGVAARGIETDLVVINKTGPYLDDLDPRVRVVELAQTRTAMAPFGLSRYLDARRPDALISSLTHVNIAAILGRSLARHKPRLVVTERNQFTRNRPLKRGLVRLCYALVPHLYRQADVVGAVAEGVRDDLARATGLSSAEIAVLHNPVVSDELFARAGEEPHHPWLTEPRSTPVILGVGRLTRQKNFSLLIRAFAELRRRRNARLIILGEGELRQDLLDEASTLGVLDDVDLPGFHRNPFAHMRQADVFALSSDWEGLPTVLIEALACGVPVVATDCESGTREILRGGQFGRIVPIDDVAAMTRALEAALDRRGDTRALVDRSLAFNLDNAVSRYLDVAGFRTAAA